MARRTDLTFKQLKEILAKGAVADCSKGFCRAEQCPISSNLPSGLVYNEIGAIFEEGGEESVVAKEFLLQCLQGDEEEKFYGYAYLSLMTEKNPEVEQELRKFEENPINQGTMQTVKNTKRRS